MSSRSLSKKVLLQRKRRSSLLLSQDRIKIESSEITAGTVNNWLKVVRLFLEMNDLILNWEKIKRMLPTIRRYALDRVPTLQELREILDAADVRG